MTAQLEEARDDAAKQVLAFRHQADELAEENRKSEDAVIELRAQLRRSQSLLGDAVGTIETLKNELQSDDAKRHADQESNSSLVHGLEKRLQQTTTALRAAQARCQVQQQEAQRASGARDRLSGQLRAANAEMDALRKEHDETRRELVHLQRCQRNAQTIEKNAARFLRGVGAAGNGGAAGKGSAAAGGGASLPEIGSPQPTADAVARAASRSAGSSSGRKKKFRPESAPLRRRDPNKAATPSSSKYTTPQTSRRHRN